VVEREGTIERITQPVVAEDGPPVREGVEPAQAATCPQAGHRAGAGALMRQPTTPELVLGTALGMVLAVVGCVLLVLVTT
jgi:hypothetical protein